MLFFFFVVHMYDFDIFIARMGKMVNISISGMISFSASEPDGMHVIIDRHLITGQNDTSTLSAVQNLILLCNAR